MVATLPGVAGTWNQKYLDYEIETIVKHTSNFKISALEIKSISITRLKLCAASRNRLKNQLEIKSISITRLKRNNRYPVFQFVRLEIKSISITRLKPVRTPFHRQSLSSWNQKYLDYEIETGNLPSTLNRPKKRLEIKSISITRLKQRTSVFGGVTHRSWNQKYLDYEIETTTQRYARH